VLKSHLDGASQTVELREWAFLLAEANAPAMIKADSSRTVPIARIIKRIDEVGLIRTPKLYAIGKEWMGHTKWEY
jgi:hypothetical protein